MAQMMFPDIGGNSLAALYRGEARGKQSRLAQLASKAYSTPTQDRGALLGQMAGVDPQAAASAQQNMAKWDDQKHEALIRSAQMLLAAPEEARPQVWQQIVSAGEIPGLKPQYDPIAVPEMAKKIVAMGDGAQGTPSQQRYAEWLLSQVPPDQRDQTLGVLAGYKPRPSSAAIQYKEVMGPDGVSRWVAMDPREVGAQVIGGGASYGSGVGGAPQPAPAGPTKGDMEGDIKLANDMIAAGIPAEQVDAFIASRGQRAEGQGVPVSNTQPPQAPAPLPARPDFQNGGTVNPFQSRPQEQQKYLDEQAQQQAQLEALPASERIKADAQVGAARGKAMAEADVKQQVLGRQNMRAFQQYEAAMRGVEKGLSGTATGPVAGLSPAVTTGQQIADGSIAAMAPILKQLFRSSGEGVFTDKDQALLMEMLPSRKDTPEARRFKIDNINQIVKFKLGQAAQQDAAPSNSVGGGWKVEVVQ